MPQLGSDVNENKANPDVTAGRGEVATAECWKNQHAVKRGSGPQQIMADLELDFPCWRVWRSAGSWWWATRRGRAWKREPRTVAADTADGLRRALCQADAGVDANSARIQQG
jgi:hypothetical protein